METEPRTFGRYRLLERLGGGGMAEVWRAEVAYSADVSKVVALKMIREDLVRVPQFLSLFIDEARITSRLSHANVAQVFDFGEEGGRPFLAMELVDGTDLETVLARARELGQFLPQSFCAYVVAEVARGLAAAHGLKDADGTPYGVVHRDVSPQNVLLSYAGEVKITDFGIARARDKITQTETGTVMGKFRYMSPEQVQGLALDARSDIFSCGILLYELVTGLQLFDGRTSAEVVDQIRYKPVPELVALRRDVDPALETVLLETLARDPAARCPDAATLARDLERYLHVAHPLFTRDEVAHLVCALLPKREPGRVGQIAFAGTELARETPLTRPPAATAAATTPPVAPSSSVAPAGSAVPVAAEEGQSPSGRKATLLGTGDTPAPPLVTAPAKRVSRGGAEGNGAEATAAAAAPVGEGDGPADADGVPEAPMTTLPPVTRDASPGPPGKPAVSEEPAGSPTPQDEGTATLGRAPLTSVPGALPAQGQEPGPERASLADAPTQALDSRDAVITAPTRRAPPGGAEGAAPGATPDLEVTRTQGRLTSPSASTVVRKPRPPKWRALALLGALAFLLGGLTALVLTWRSGSGPRRPPRTSPSDLPADARAADILGRDATARPSSDGGAAPGPAVAVAELDRKLEQMPILRGPRDDRVLRALAAGTAHRLSRASVDAGGRRRLGPRPPEALVLPATDPLAESVASAVDLLAERILLAGELPPEGKALLGPLPEPLPDRATLLERFPGSALYVVDQPVSALAMELHLRATGWRKGWRPPLAGAGGRRLLWPHLSVARDAVARFGELAPKSTFGQALRRYLDAHPRQRKVKQGALWARLSGVTRQAIKKSPTIGLELLVDLWNQDPHKPIPVRPLEWRLHGVATAPLSPNYWDPEGVDQLAPGKHLTLKVTFSLPASEAPAALVLSLPVEGEGALWFQAESELLP